jgi:TolB-like protein/Tfp pilus assembly protein PilF
MAFPLPDKPSIAVLPFDNMSGDPEQDFFSDGLTEDVITGLSRFPDLFVVARNSTFSYKGQQVPVRRVAEELGVRYVLEGSVQEAGDTIRVTAQLIDATTGHHLWAESYDRKRTDVFAVRDEVTQTIIATVMGDTGQLTRAEIKRVLGKDPENLQAYELVLKGVDIWLHFTPEANREAAVLFNKAISLDPGYARAYAVLAWVHLNDYRYLWSEDPQKSLALAHEIAQKSVELDDTDDWCHWALGVVHLYRREFALAHASYQRAIDINPNYADLLAHSGFFLTFSGRPREGIDRIKSAMRLNPYYGAWYPSALGFAQYQAGLYEPAVITLKEAIDRNWGVQAHQHLAATYARLGRAEEARNEVARILQMNPDIAISEVEKRLPFKNSADLENYLEGLRLAGLPEQSPLPLRDKPSIAVLPFANMSGDSDLDYFSDGMTEDIILELSKNPDLKVVSRNSSFTYRNKAVKARQVSEELGVRYVLEGSVRKQGNKVRITAQLIDATTDSHVWADRFDEQGTDVFALQDRIAQRIDATLSGQKGKIRDAEYERAWQMDAAKLEEYDYFLRGHSIMYGFTPQAMLKAREIWQEGLRKFPESGLLRVKIGWTHFFFFHFGWSDEPEKDLEHAYQLAQEGLADENLPLVGQWNGHWLNAFVQLWHKRDFDRALEEAITTLAIVPNDSDTLAFNAAIAVYAGKPDLALEWVSRAISREPYVPEWYYIHLGQAYHYKGDCGRAVDAFTKVPWPALDKSTSLVACYVELGKIDDARIELANLLDSRPALAATNIGHGLPYRDQDFFHRLLSALVESGLPE